MFQAQVRAHHNVIVRAFGDEPVLMTVLSVKGDNVEVARPGKNVTLFIASVYVYEYDKDSLDSLTDAWNRRDSDVLINAWKSVAHANLRDMEVGYGEAEKEARSEARNP